MPTMTASLNSYRETLTKLYLEDDKTLKEVKDEMYRDYGINASKNQYERKFKEWGLRKNLTKREWRFIHNRLEKRKVDNKDDFELRVNGYLIDKKKVCKEVNRNKPLTFQESLEAVDASTPDGLSILSPPPLDLQPSQDPERLQDTNFYTSTASNDQSAEGPSELANSHILQGTHERSSTALYDDRIIQTDLNSTPNPPGQQEVPTTTFAASEIYLPSRTQNLVTSVQIPQDNSTTNNPTLLEYSEELNPFRPGSLILPIRKLEISTPKPGVGSIYSGLSRDPRTDGSIITDWADKNGLTTEQWDNRLYDYEMKFDDKDDARLSNTLQLASFEGHYMYVELLLSKGAEVNAQGGLHGNALQAASFRGHSAIVELVLSKGADVNAQGGWYGNALQAASLEGHSAIVELLLSKGADVNAQGGEYGNALQAASVRGHLAIIELVLSKGADVNAQGGWYVNALQAASVGGHSAVVELLLSKGADFNAQGGLYGNALQAASFRGHSAIVRLLRRKGARKSQC